MNKQICLATNNKGKLREYREILAPLGYLIVCPKDLNIESDPEETGDTFKANALIKAKAMRRLVKMPVIADDSGLCIRALNDFPGIRSARYAQEFGGDYKKAMAALLESLQEKSDRYAEFRCAICLLENEDSKPLFFEGVCPGSINKVIKGQGGFGYDPFFHCREADVDFGTCDEAIKNAYSHRAKAILKLATYLAI